MLNSPSTIDEGFRGDVKVILYNASMEVQTIEPMDRIAQLVFKEVPTVSLVSVPKLDDTERGEKGYGSSGQ